VRLSWLELVGFRSYARLRLEPDPGVNVVVGPNGSGKTNLLEGIGYLSTLASFRSAPNDAVVRQGEDSAVIRGEVERGGSAALVEIELTRHGRNRAQVNRRRLIRTADLLGEVRAVFFLPDDLDIVKRGPAGRRELLDRLAVQLAPAAQLDLAEYDRALRQRNTLLRQSHGLEPDRATLEVWDDRLSQAGARVVIRRRAAMRALGRHLGDTYSLIAGTPTGVEMRYATGWTEEQDGEVPALAAALAAALRAARRLDRERRATTVGPHRDEPSLWIDGRETRTRASQGEQRTLALSLRLASFHSVSEVVGEAPLLLLDDVFSELDLKRSGALSGALPTEAQVFVTSARDEEVPLSGRRWDVTDGGVT
jgi:DNA replication and repair protein RecF